MPIYSVLDEIDGKLQEVLIVTSHAHISDILVPIKGNPRKKSVESYRQIVFTGDEVEDVYHLREMLDGYIAFAHNIMEVEIT